MLSALEHPHRWNEHSWTPVIATAADEPAEVLARLAAHFGELAIELVTTKPTLGVYAARHAKKAVHFARLALVVEALSSDRQVVFVYDLVDGETDDLVAVFDPPSST